MENIFRDYTNQHFLPKECEWIKIYVSLDWLIDWGFLLYPQYFSHLKEIAVKKYGQFWNLEVSLAALTSLHYKSSKSREMVFCVLRFESFFHVFQLFGVHVICWKGQNARDLLFVIEKCKCKFHYFLFIPDNNYYFFLWFMEYAKE